ncbi:MAG TPA: DALR anticodon-binding domain-containing protein [Streptosporangiaceae bacterium]
MARAGGGCVASDLLRGRTAHPAPRANLTAASSWAQARQALAAELTVRLALAAGAQLGPGEQPRPALVAASEPVAAAVAYAGEDAVRFWLARGGPLPDPGGLARQVLDNPAYAVRYAHAAAAAVLRWAGSPPGEFRPGLLAEPAQRALLDALSWLPERVAVAARRERPDVFARYLEALASRTIDTMSTTEPTSEMLWLALAARTALGAGLDLLGVSAPARVLRRGKRNEPCRPPGRSAPWRRATRRSPAGAGRGSQRAGRVHLAARLAARP